MVNWVGNQVSNVKNWASNTWNGVKQTVGNAWNNAKTYLANRPNYQPQYGPYSTYYPISGGYSGSSGYVSAAQQQAIQTAQRQQRISNEYSKATGNTGKPKTKEGINLHNNWGKALSEFLTHFCTTAKKTDKQDAKKNESVSLPTTKGEITRDYHWSTIHNMYVNNKTGRPSKEVTYLYNKFIAEESAPRKDPQLEFYNEMIRTGKHPTTGKTLTNAEKANAKLMIYSLVVQPFVGVYSVSKLPQNKNSVSSKSNTAVNNSDKKASGAGGTNKNVVSTLPEDGNSTVGRWMSNDEYNKMIDTGKVQMSPNGNRTYVASPASKDAFPSAPNGSIYSEFDVAKNSLYPAGNENWSQIPGPGSLIDRLNQKKGLPAITVMPDALNIKNLGGK